MSDQPPSLGDHESEVIDALREELTDHLNLTLFAFNTGLRTLNALPDRPITKVSQAEKVAVSLLVRFLNDLRCSSLLGARGYALQACSLTSSAFESAYTLAFIGDDEALAEEWIDHGDPTVPFRKVRTLVREVVERRVESNAQKTIDRHYRIYQQLCMAKHLNPLLQRGHGYALEEGNVVAEVGPQATEAAVRATWFVLEHGTGLTEMALESFVPLFVPEASQPPLEERIESIRSQRSKLHERGLNRWGAEDPFPERW